METIMNPYHYIAIAVVVILYCLFLYLGKLPSMESVQRLATLLDTKGGNIIVLTSLALYFFHDATVMYYVVIDKIKDGTITADNGIALNGLMFATGAFSGVSGALLKVMSGADPAKGVTTTTATTVTASTETTPAPNPAPTSAPTPASAPVSPSPQQS
jgi:fumarate reductase subunit D